MHILQRWTLYSIYIILIALLSVTTDMLIKIISKQKWANIIFKILWSLAGVVF